LRILISDQHQEFRTRVRELLETRPGFEICGEAADGEELVLLSRQLLPDVIVTEYTLPIIDGLEASELIKRFHPQVLILVVSFDQNKQLLSRARSVGVNGYVPKLEARDTLLRAVEIVAQGGLFFPEDDLS
jgi:two-component system, NarL family, response regulator NreC